MSKGPFDSIWEEADRRTQAYAESARAWKAERDEAVEALETLRRRIMALVRDDDGDALSPVARADVRALLDPPKPVTALDLVDALQRSWSQDPGSEEGRLLEQLRRALQGEK